MTLALEGSPVSSLKCDRWHRSKFRELLGRCLRRQWNTDCSKPRGLCHGTRAVAGQVARPAAGSPTGAQWAWTGVQEGRAGLLGSYVAWRKRNKADIWKLMGTILNTVQGSLYLQSRTHTDTHTHTHSGLRNGPTYVALALWLNGLPCKWSGVEWTSSIT